MSGDSGRGDGGGERRGVRGAAAPPLPAGRLSVEGLLLLLPPDGRSVRELAAAAPAAPSEAAAAAASARAGEQAGANADCVDAALVRVREPRLQLVGVEEAVALLGLPHHTIRCEHLFRLPPTPPTVEQPGGALAAATPAGTARSEEQLREAMRALWRRLSASASHAVQPPVTFEWTEADGAICARSLRLVADPAIQKLRCTFEHQDEALVVACLSVLRAR